MQDWPALHSSAIVNFRDPVRLSTHNNSNKSFSPLQLCVVRLTPQSSRTMALCGLCLTVPFTALPRLTGERRGTTLLADNAESPQIMFQAGDEIDSPDAELPHQIGFPFHRDLDALSLSARSCPICNIAQTGVQGWIDRWEDAAKNDKSFIEFDLQRDPIPVGQQLWLTACDDGEQGFCVWAKNPATPKFLYLLAVVRFYVEPGLFRPSNSCSKLRCVS